MWRRRCPMRSIPRARGATIWSSARPSWRWPGRSSEIPRSARWLAAGDKWARAFLVEEADKDTLNLYDTSALAHAELVQALRDRRTSTRACRAGCSTTCARSWSAASGARAADPFAAGAVYDDFDAAPHTFGLVATAAALSLAHERPRLRRVRDVPARLGAGRQRLGRVAHDRGGTAVPALPAARGGEPLREAGRQAARAASAPWSTGRTTPACSPAASTSSSRTATPARPARRLAEGASAATAAASSTTSAPGRRSSRRSTSTPRPRWRSRSRPPERG